MLGRASRRVLPKRIPGRGFASTITVDNPYTQETFCEVPCLDEKAALAMVEQASRVQREWNATTTLERRVEVVQGVMKHFKDNAEAIAGDISNMMGKPVGQALGEVNGIMERCEAMCEFAPGALEDEMLPAKDGFLRKIAREPVGVVLVLAPWNYPLLTTVNALIPAVLAGNSVVLKHSPRTPLCADHFERAFLEAGAPAGLVQALHTGNETVHSVIKQPEIGFVSFTGSVKTGHTIYQSVAATRFIDTTLELGGKDAAYVAEDANLDAAVAGVIDGAFYNAGQSCCGLERVFVHENHYDAFVEKANAILSSYILGDPMDGATTLGPLAMPDQPGFLAAQVEQARNNGAIVLTGGSPTTDENGKGRFFAPTLVVEAPLAADIMQKESFGPVLAATPVKNDEEAIRLMNNCDYGLTGVLFTEDLDRASALAPQIEAGTVFMNRCDYLDPMLPWTGVKDTGKGISLSHHGFRAFSRLKGYHFRLNAS